MINDLQVFETKPLLDLHVAGWLTRLAVASTGQFRIALSGGTTPQSMYRLLAKEPLRSRFPWPRVHWYWGDERFVPHDDPQSNYAMAWAAFLSKVPAPEGNIHAMPVDGTTDSAAQRYEAELKHIFGADHLDPARPFFDVNLLGIGPDGHTASLLPGTDVLGERKRWVAPVFHGRPEPRITLTYPVLESSRYVAFLVSGSGKAEALKRALNGDTALPAARLRSKGKVIWFVDAEAASQLPSVHPIVSHPAILLLMGVSGSGKSTIGKLLAKRLGLPFKEGDDFYPQANIDKMRAGHPLDDTDRQPWLAAIADWMDQQTAHNRSGIIACSALKRSYRDYLRQGRSQVLLVYLRGNPEVLAERLAHRQCHFMPASLLDSQCDALEEPAPEEHPLIADDDAKSDEIVEQIMDLLATRPAEWRAPCRNA